MATLLTVALLAATAGSPAAGASTPASLAQSKPLSACAKAKAALRKAKTKKAKAKAAARVKVACKKPKPKPTVKNVSIALDSARAATQTIGAEGGSITATGAGGTTFTLTLPAEALVGPTEVQVIPIKSVTGLGGRVSVAGAVQLEPEGLGLFKTATLTITPSALSGKSTQAFGWYGAGKTLGRYPSTRTGTRFVLQIAHFSGDGVAEGESDNLALMQSLQDALKTHYEQSVRPLMTRAETDDSIFDQATQDYLGWYRQLALLGLDETEPFSQELAGLKDSWEKAFQNHVDKASARCANEHKLGEIFSLLTTARQLALLGYEQQSDDAFNKAKACGHFELDFETVMTRTDAPAAAFGEKKAVSHVRELGLQLDLQPPLGDGSGEMQIDYLSWTYNATTTVGAFPCTFSGDSTSLGDPFRVTRFSLSATRTAGPDGTPQLKPPVISMTVFPGEPTEWLTETCTTPFGSQVVPHIIPSSRYTGTFTGLYADQANKVEGWDILGGSVYARKTYERVKDFSVGGLTWTEDERTTYDLKHTPQS